MNATHIESSVGRGRLTAWLAGAAILIIAVVGVVYIAHTRQSAGPTIYIGSSMKKPMEQCIAAFKEKTGIVILADYGDSGDVLIKVRKSGLGEAAVLHQPYMSQMVKEGLAQSTHTLAYMVPAIAVQKGNPRHVKGLRDFTRADLTVGLTDARYTTSGLIVQDALKAAGIQKQVMDRKPMEDRSSGFMVNKVQIKALDAATAWNSVIAGADGVDMVPIEPELMPREFKEEGLTYLNGAVPVGLVVLKTSKYSERTGKFVEFLLSPEGRAIWKANGYAPTPPTAQPEPTTRPS